MRVREIGILLYYCISYIDLSTFDRFVYDIASIKSVNQA